MHIDSTQRRYGRMALIAALVLAVMAVSVAPASAGKRGHKRKDAPVIIVDDGSGDTDTGGDTGGTGPFDTVPTWSAEFMTTGSGSPGYDPGLTNALRQANNFDVIAAHQWTYNDYVAQMRAANPDLKLFVYLNGTFSSSQTSTQYPDSWYLRDANGNKIRAIGFNTYLLDPRNPAWQAEVLRLCQTRLVYSGYDGCFVDVLGLSGVNPLSVTGVPIDPRTGVAWTKTAWLQATEGIAEYVRTAIAPRPVMGNGLGFGGSYFNKDAPTESILDGMSGGMAEVFVRPAFSAVNFYKNEVNWKYDVDMLADAAARGQFVTAITKVWSSSTAAQQDAWHRYALGTFLLGYQPGSAYFTFRTDKNLTTPSPYWDVQIGDPTGAYAKVGGVYQRTFTNGRVLVNPTTASVTVSLGGSYKNLDGGTVSSVTLAPHAAQILTLA
jgi:hypothetical protein